MTNAFDWKTYTEEERKKNGDPFRDIKLGARNSKQVSESVRKIQEKNPYHGTIMGISDKADSMINVDRRRRLNKLS